MRKDVNKILTECYKEGPHGNKFPRRAVNERFDEVGGKMGMHFLYDKISGAPGKSFGENLSYLSRFLEKQIGRKWNDIYSEICSTFDRRSAVNEHIFQHLFDYFTPAEQLLEIDGKLIIQNQFMKATSLEESHSWSARLYVDPKDGILKRNKKWRSYDRTHRDEKKDAAAELAKVKRVLKNGDELHKLEDGSWHLFVIKPIPPVTIRWVYDWKPWYTHEEWMAQKEAQVAFKNMSREDRKKYGKRVEIKPNLGKLSEKIPYFNRSPLTEQHDHQGLLPGHPHFRHRRAVGATHYYASMRSPSKQELRAAGL